MKLTQLCRAERDSVVRIEELAGTALGSASDVERLENGSPEKGRVLNQSGRTRSSNWFVATLLVVGCAIVYLALRPPLYDFDGYMFRLYALLPSRFSNSNPHHLLWNTVQILLTVCAAALGQPNTVPFQIFGILVNCLTLFATYWLLLAVGKSRLVAIAGVVFVAFSPAFWYVGLQNHPYPLAFLAIVLYLTAWHREDGHPPEGLRLYVAGLSLALSILFHQGVIVLLPVATCVLIAYGRGTIWQKLTRALVWTAGVAGLVATAYVCLWQFETTGPDQTIVGWSTDYLNSVHPMQLFELGFPTTFARSVMGLSGMLVQDYRIRWLLFTSLSRGEIFALYDGIGLLAVIALIVAMYRAFASGALSPLLRTNSLFGLSLFSLGAWCAFCFAWEPATVHYWTLGLFPALVSIAMLVRGRSINRRFLMASVLLVNAWNCYSNYAYDRNNSRNFPDPLLASIKQHVGPHDNFLVLGDDHWFANVNYILLFRVLNYSARNPGVAIFNDLILSPGGMQNWRDKLRAKIDSTLDSGGQVFVASHVFDPASYRDLSNHNDPFNEQIDQRYLTIDGPAFYQDLRQFFAGYQLTKSNFSVGSDAYFAVAQRPK